MDEYQQLLIDYCYEHELSKSSIKGYLQALEHYKQRYGYEFNKDNMLDFKTSLLENLNPKTVNTYLAVMHRLFELIGKPELKVKRLKVQKKTHVENVISEKQYKKLCRCLLEDNNLKYYWIVQFLAKTGVRVSELVQFKKEHLEEGEMVLHTKGKIRTVHIPDSLIKESKEYFDTVDSEYLFPNRYNKPFTTKGVAHQFASYAKKYNIAKEVMHPHSFRHFFAIKMMKKTKDITLVSDLLGHSSIETTMIYTRISKEEQIKKLNRFIDW